MAWVRAQAGGQHGIDDGMAGPHMVAHNHVLADLFLIDEGDDVGDLTGGAGGGGDGHQGQALLFHLVGALIALDGPLVVQQNVDGLGGVDGAAAAHGHNAVHAGLGGHLIAGLHHAVGGVGDNRVKHHGLNIGLGQRSQHLVGNAAAHNALVTHNQDLFQADFRYDFAQLGNAVPAEIDLAGDMINGAHDCSPLLFDRVWMESMVSFSDFRSLSRSRYMDR